MEQRPLRLGNDVDDYCPRERRITNHVIVAIVGDAIRQTRCVACDVEHVYKAAKPPRRRLPPAGVPESAAETGVTAEAAGPGGTVPPPLEAGASAPVPADGSADRNETGPDAGGEEEPVPEAERHDDGWAVRRPLIRATLPRSENDQPPPRPIPEFTMHQRHPRGGHSFRPASGWYDRSAGPRRQGREPGNGRGGAQGPGFGSGFGQGPRDPNARHGKHRGKKRSR
jgi:hypothetical protein